MASFGEELRRQRELRAVSLREISDATKINIRFLEALEGNDFKHLPGGQFNKGFIRAYARHIGVSGEEMVEAYLVELRGQEEGGGPRRAATPRGSEEPPPVRTMMGVALAVVLVLTVAGFSWLFLRWKSTQDSPAASARSTAAHESSPRGDDATSMPGAVEGQDASSDAVTRPAEPGSRVGDSGTSAGSPESAPPDEALPAEPGTSSSGGRIPDEGGSRSSIQEPSTAREDAPPQPPEGRPPLPGSVQSGAPPPAPPAGQRPIGDAPGGELAMRVIPFQPVKFSLLCGGKELYSGQLAAGNALRFQCNGVYEVTLDDAGAVSMSVNGERIYLGRPGQSIAGRHVSAQNYLDFARPPSEGQR